MSDARRSNEVMVTLSTTPSWQSGRVAAARPRGPSSCAVLLRGPPSRPRVADRTRRSWRSCPERARAGKVTPRSRLSGRFDTRTTGTSTMSSLGYSAIELLEGLEDAQSGLRDLEEAVEGMKDPPDDLVEAVDRIRRALADF